MFTDMSYPRTLTDVRVVTYTGCEYTVTATANVIIGGTEEYFADLVTYTLYNPSHPLSLTWHYPGVTLGNPQSFRNSRIRTTSYSLDWLTLFRHTLLRERMPTSTLAFSVPLFTRKCPSAKADKLILELLYRTAHRLRRPPKVPPPIWSSRLLLEHPPHQIVQKRKRSSSSSQ